MNNESKIGLNECGDCTLCCQLMNIDDDSVHAPRGVMCNKCDGNGCSIYEDRPKDCAVWECNWLRFGWDQHLKPNVCHAMFYADGPDQDRAFAVVHCDPEHPTAWQSLDVLSVIDPLISRFGHIDLRVGNEDMVIERDDETRHYSYGKLSDKP